MATPSHVIEIEAGNGEPASIVLTQGQELEPISIGKKGSWRLEFPDALDVHGFAYFDGTSLYLHSARDDRPLLVEGRSIEKKWTIVAPPSAIDLGGARLRFRSLAADEHEAATVALARAPVEMPPNFSAASAPAKPERPFAPGALAPRDDETTRFAPLDPTVERPQQPFTEPMRMPTAVLEQPGVRPALPQTPAPKAPLGPSSAPALPAPYQGASASLGYPPPMPGPPMPPQAGQLAPPAPPSDLAASRETSGSRSLPTWAKLLVALVPFYVVAAYYAFFDDRTPADSTRARAADASSSAAPASASADARPPLTVVATGPLPATRPTPQISAAPLPKGMTLERQATDYLARRDYARAAETYERLAAQAPQNRAYVEAARILRTKLDGGR